MPISRAISVTDTSMMFMMTMPPTTSDRATSPEAVMKMAWEICFQKSVSDSELSRAKSSSWLGFRRWRTRITTRASSLVAAMLSLSRASMGMETEPRVPNCFW